MMKLCTACKTEAPDASDFCEKCGAALPAGSPAGQASAWAPPGAAGQPAAQGEGQPAAWQAVAPEGIAMPESGPEMPGAPMWVPDVRPDLQKARAPRVAGICAAVAIFLAAGAAALYFWMPKSPQAKAEAALSKTEKAMTAQLDAVGKGMGYDVLKKLDTEPSKTGLSMDLPQAVPGLPGGISFQLDTYTDPAAGLSNAQLTSSLDLSGEFFIEKEKLTVSAPGLLQKPVYFSIEKLAQGLADGSLGDMFTRGYSLPPKPGGDFDGDGGWESLSANDAGAGTAAAPMISLGGAAGLSGLLNAGPDYDKIEKKLDEAYQELREAGVYSEEKETPAGFSEEMDKIYIHYPDKAADIFVRRCVEIFVEAMEEALPPDTAAELKQSMPAFSNAKISQVVYIDQKGFCRANEYTAFLTADGVTAGVAISMRTADGANPLNDCALTITAMDDGETQAVILTGKAEKGSFGKESGLDYAVNIETVEGGKNTVTGSVRLTHDPSAAGDNFTLGLKAKNWRDEMDSYELRGRLAASSKSLELSLSRLKMVSYGETQDIALNMSLACELTGTYKGRPVPEGAQDGFAMTPEEWQEALAGLSEKFMEIMGGGLIY